MARARSATLPALLHDLAARLPPSAHGLDASAWEAAPYRPVPSIVEAARMLYSRNGVDEIAAARADAGNLTRTSDAIRAGVAHAQRTGSHLVLFVTGIPGAGKTLCGLNAVFGSDATGAAFLTGNLPLVRKRDPAAERLSEGQPRSARPAA